MANWINRNPRTSHALLALSFVLAEVASYALLCWSKGMPFGS